MALGELLWAADIHLHRHFIAWLCDFEHALGGAPCPLESGDSFDAIGVEVRSVEHSRPTQHGDRKKDANPESGFHAGRLSGSGPDGNLTTA